MKYLPLVLKVVAILAAAFCVYAWMDTKGQIKTSMEHMKDVSGEDIVTKASNVPGIIDTQKKTQESLSKSDATLKTTQAKVAELNSDLEAERAKSIQINGELQKRSTELRNANTSLEASKKKVAESESTIAALKQEIVNTKALMSKTDEADGLKKKVAALESDLAAKEAELTAANAKIKNFEASELVEVKEVDPVTGKETVRKVYKTPYVSTGDIATVLGVLPEKGANVFAINRGKNGKLETGQKLLLKRDGVNIAEATVDEVYDDYSTLIFNSRKYIPETIEANDQLELIGIQDAAPAPAAAPAAEAAEKPAAAAPTAEEPAAPAAE